MPSNDFVDGVQNVGIVGGFLAGLYAWAKATIRIAGRSHNRSLARLDTKIKGSAIISTIENTLTKLLESNVKLAEQIVHHMEQEKIDREEIQAAIKNLSDRLDMHLTHHY